MRPFLALAAGLLALLPPVLAAGGRATTTAVHATPVPFARGGAAGDRAGRLRWLGGWALRSDDRRFGGFSALAATGPGRLVAVSDSGLVARLVVDEGVTGTVAPMPADPGTLKQDRDAESLAYDPVTGQWWIGFEGRDVIVRYAPGLARRVAMARPPAMAGWPVNGGPEALVRLRDGRMLVIAEKASGRAGGREALLFPRDPTTGDAPPLRFTYRPPPGHSPSDAALLPDGRVLVLNRRATIGWPPFVAALTIIDPRRFTAGAVVTGESVADLAAPLTVDNLEGVAVSREGARTIVWLVSDDNFLPIQRTLLLKFALD